MKPTCQSTEPIEIRILDDVYLSATGFSPLRIIGARPIIRSASVLISGREVNRQPAGVREARHAINFRYLSGIVIK